MDNAKPSPIFPSNDFDNGQNQVNQNPLLEVNNSAPNAITDSPNMNAYQAAPNNQNLPPTNNYPYNQSQNTYQNITPQYNYYNPAIPYNPNPYNQNISPQGYPPYNPNIPNPNPIIIQQSNPNALPPNCLRTMLLVMSILMFIIIIIDIILFILLQYGTGIIFIMIDDIGILCCAILFLISFIYSKENKVNSVVRTILVGIVWFVGFGLRGAANMFIREFGVTGYLFGILVVRTMILFFSIPISQCNINILPNNERINPVVSPS